MSLFRMRLRHLYISSNSSVKVGSGQISEKIGIFRSNPLTRGHLMVIILNNFFHIKEVGSSKAEVRPADPKKNRVPFQH